MTSGARAAFVLALVVPLLAASCWGSTATVPPSAAATAPGNPSLTPVPDGSAADDETQTDTDWGRIWNTLPGSFPLPQGALPATNADERVSGSYAVGQSGEQLADFMQERLPAAGFGIESVDGPSADGGYTLNAVGNPVDCRLQVRIQPLSGTTRLLVLYGAACPFD